MTQHGPVADPMPTAAEISPQWHIRREEITGVAIAAPTPRPTTVPFDLAAVAPHGRGPTVGLWALSNALFGFNQVFLAVALLAFGIAGTGLLADRHGWLGYLGAALLLFPRRGVRTTSRERTASPLSG